jgi:hypothetical protein
MARASGLCSELETPLSKSRELARSSNQTTALAAPSEPWLDPEWQRLWLSIAPKQWRSLGLIPAGEGASLEFTLMVSLTLSRTGMVHLGNPIQVADATQIPLSHLNSFLKEVNRCTTEGHRILVALPPAETGPTSSAIAQSLDAALLCVLFERMSTAQAQKTVRLIGPSRFLGSVVLHSSQVSKLK